MTAHEKTWTGYTQDLAYNTELRLGRLQSGLRNRAEEDLRSSGPMNVALPLVAENLVRSSNRRD